MDDERAWQLLGQGEYGVLASIDANQQPYATPLSYVLEGNSLYFHSAKSGQKIQNIAAHPQVSFTVVGKTQPVYTDNFSTYFESVMVFGQVQQVLEEPQKIQVLTWLCQKYLPAYLHRADTEIQKSLTRTAVYEIKIQHLTGKAKDPEKITRAEQTE